MDMEDLKTDLSKIISVHVLLVKMLWASGAWIPQCKDSCPRVGLLKVCAPASSGNLLGIQIIGPHSRLTESETLRVESSDLFSFFKIGPLTLDLHSPQSMMLLCAMVTIIYPVKGITIVR